MMLLLKQSTSVVISFGPFVDKADGVTLKTGLVSAIDHASTGIMLSKNGGTLAVRHATVTASTYDAHGCYKVTLDATDTGTLGTLRVIYTDAATCLAVWMDFHVVPAMIYDSIVSGSDRFDVNVTHIADTSQTARDVGASVLLSAGTGTGQLDFTSGVVKANAVQWLGGTIPAVNVTGVPLVDAKYLLGTIFNTPTVAGIPNVNVKTWNDLTTVALPLVPTVAGRTLDVSTGGEAGVDWANVGSPTTTVGLSGTTINTVTAVTGLTASNLDATISSRMATYTQPTGFLAATFPGGTIANTTNITAGTITTATNVTTVNGLAAGVITAASIAADAITAAKIADGAIDAATFAAGAIDAAAIATDAIGASEIAASAITKIQTGLATPTNITSATGVNITGIAGSAVAVDTGGVGTVSFVSNAYVATAGATVSANVVQVDGENVANDGNGRLEVDVKAIDGSDAAATVLSAAYAAFEYGTAQAGGASEITLRSGASAVDDELKDQAVFLLSGTGAGQTNRITAYNGTTKVATVSTAWATQPDNSTVYVVLGRIE